jgi:hypothetical protein
LRYRLAPFLIVTALAGSLVFPLEGVAASSGVYSSVAAGLQIVIGEPRRGDVTAAPTVRPYIKWRGTIRECEDEPGPWCPTSDNYNMPLRGVALSGAVLVDLNRDKPPQLAVQVGGGTGHGRYTPGWQSPRTATTATLESPVGSRFRDEPLRLGIEVLGAGAHSRALGPARASVGISPALATSWSPWAPSGSSRFAMSAGLELAASGWHARD